MHDGRPPLGREYPTAGIPSTICPGTLLHCHIITNKNDKDGRDRSCWLQSPDAHSVQGQFHRAGPLRAGCRADHAVDGFQGMWTCCVPGMWEMTGIRGEWPGLSARRPFLLYHVQHFSVLFSSLGGAGKRAIIFAFVHIL